MYQPPASQGGVRLSWRPWPADPRILVSDSGLVWGPRPALRRLTKPSPDGYFHVTISLGGQRRNIPLHTLVAEAWHGARPPGHEVAHNNGVPTDNRACNLRWATRQSNVADRTLHGTTVRGERHKTSVLTEVLVAEMRAEYAKGKKSHRELAERFSLTPSAIGSALTGRTWAHVPGALGSTAPGAIHRGERVHRARLTENDVRSIRRDFAGGWSRRSLARRHNVSRTSIQGILSGRLWKHVQ